MEGAEFDARAGPKLKLLHDLIAGPAFENATLVKSERDQEDGDQETEKI
jgi:hypothetical protein